MVKDLPLDRFEINQPIEFHYSEYRSNVMEILVDLQSRARAIRLKRNFQNVFIRC